MNCSIPLVSSDGTVSWSNSCSMDSDDHQSEMELPPPAWIDCLSSDDSAVAAASGTSSSLSFSRTGQLTPVSNGMDVSSAASDSSAPFASPSTSPSIHGSSHSASSSACASTERWALEGIIGLEEGAEVAYGNDEHGILWEEGSDIGLAVPKIEPMDDDDVRMDDIKEAPSTSVATTGPSAGNPANTKRPRGRPRKHPLTANVVGSKITKGRSKTGCLTCRKRKKKCDEAKPRCMNCEKNAVVCEGYPEKQIWKSGKERAEEERIKSYSLPPITMHPIFHGLETVEDMIFWKHYNEHLSTVLTVEGEHKNAFKDMMVPIAVRHQGLMHSILSLASKHIDFETPYGINILRNNPTTTIEALVERALHHHDQARLKFYSNVEIDEEKPDHDAKHLVSARYGQMLCFLLEALAEGNPRGEHRLHLSAYQNLISSSPPDDPGFLSFIAEFFQYHIFADELIHSAGAPEHPSSPQLKHPIPTIHPPRLLGVADGLLSHLSQITTIRNTIRSNMLAQVDPVIDYTCLYNATEIDAAIREWTPHWPPSDSRDRVGLLYKQMMRVYLMRTIYPPLPSSPPSSMTSSTMSLSITNSSASVSRPTSSAVNTPPRSASTSCASSPKRRDSSSTCPSGSLLSSPQPKPPVRKHSSSSDISGVTLANAIGSPRAESPQPIRQPPQQDPRVAITVNESLAILETFKPSDPSQTLLLLPCFILGTACFSPEQQDRIRTAIKAVRGYTGLRNTDRVLEVLGEVWRLMEAGDWAAVWDWPSVAQNLNLDFIPA
ncbi:transcriptional regulatory protein moc3 [Rhypophila decipiens]|uniref:Transcriptional regulatory protein moc3 n=1 Tax=Rhypophila decipiens TaxID=261697 RepID=A0AAN6YGR1_9PEZI|nr:transcriptional regulatory protein moc3 [Rhypophila decipiens]